MKQSKIYCLVCPVLQQPVYVGQTTQPLSTRLGLHLSDVNKSLKYEWIDSLNGQGLKPVIVLLETVPLNKGDEREKWWMVLLASVGAPLLNSNTYGSNIAGLLSKKILVPHTTWLIWSARRRHGDLTKIEKQTGITVSRLQQIISMKQGTPKEVEAINKYYGVHQSKDVA
jgi:hypothetical protein